MRPFFIKAIELLNFFVKRVLTQVRIILHLLKTLRSRLLVFSSCIA